MVYGKKLGYIFLQWDNQMMILPYHDNFTGGGLEEPGFPRVISGRI